jgi:hypothetical protein
VIVGRLKQSHALFAPLSFSRLCSAYAQSRAEFGVRLSKIGEERGVPSVGWALRSGTKCPDPQPAASIAAG